MRMAVISDVHGNLPALEAVLADVKNRGADFTVNLSQEPDPIRNTWFSCGKHHQWVRHSCDQIKRLVNDVDETAIGIKKPASDQAQT